MTVSVYSVATLAARWGCGTDTVYALVRSGELRHFKLGGKLIRIRADEVERYERREPSPASGIDQDVRAAEVQARKSDAADLRLERLIDRPSRPKLVHSSSRRRGDA
ncbi:helix-turn-helix domain-containing protein [Sphingomonas sp. BK580]|uniref:helix-turn-helix domain-containing protein n=1 Tax=Sphingomonas sp. BK580 TaxID=2586972 RepID=UPI00161E9C8A|nr:helix-turn-helix domain-containing protein [Sphingomonas sp. BK580]MBB3692483.1 excisionase family DNA binding protein [Sphingomonas sp. BK580]